MLSRIRFARSAVAGTLLLSMSSAACAPAPVGAGVSPRIRIGADNPALRGPTGTVLVWDSGGVTVVHRPRGVAPDTVRVPPRPATRPD